MHVNPAEIKEVEEAAQIAVPEHLRILKVMLGAVHGIDASCVGFRNHYAVREDGPALPALRRLEADGLVEQISSEGSGAKHHVLCFVATAAGCAAAGLDGKATMRAIANSGKPGEPDEPEKPSASRGMHP